jgi:hypothetical protein
MRIQSSHSRAARGLDAYFTPPEATAALLVLERGKIPRRLWEPAAGAGGIADPLRAAGFHVVVSDLVDYGAGIKAGIDYLTAPRPRGVQGIVTNPPFGQALAFAKKALDEVPYLGLLLRTNWLESQKRLPFFRRTPPTRIWISSLRLPMMHRLGWTGKKSTSNVCFAWFVWQRGAPPEPVNWFDWRALLDEGEPYRQSVE